MSFLDDLLLGIRQLYTGGVAVSTNGNPPPTGLNFTSGVSAVYNATTRRWDVTLTGVPSVVGSGFLHYTGGNPDSTASHGSPGQLPFGTGTDTSWTSVSGDVASSVSTIGQLEVVGIGNNVLPTITGSPAGTLYWTGTAWELLSTGSIFTPGGDLSSTSTTSTQYIQSLSYSSSSAGGTIEVKGTGTTLQWAANVTAPGISQAAPTSDVAPVNTTYSSQGPWASATANKSAASLVFETPAPVSGGNYGFPAIWEAGGTTLGGIGPVSNTLSDGGIWLGTGTFSPGNVALYGDGSNLVFNTISSSGIFKFENANTEILSVAIGTDTVQGGNAVAVTALDSQNLFFASSANIDFSANGGAGIVRLAGTYINIIASNLEFSSAVTPTILQQGAGSDVATKNLTLTSQAPYASAATNLSPGNIQLNTPAPVSGGSTGFSVFQSGGVSYGAIGLYNSTAGEGALWLGQSSFTTSNWAVLCASGNTQINASSEVIFDISGSAKVGVTTSALQPYADLGVTSGGASNRWTSVAAGPTGFEVFHASGDAHASSQMGDGTIYLGAGGATAADLYLYRAGASTLQVTNASTGNATLLVGGASSANEISIASSTTTISIAGNGASGGTATSLTLSPQAANASGNSAAGNLVVALGAPSGSGGEAYTEFTRNGAAQFWLGADPSSSGSIVGLWGPVSSPTNANWFLFNNGTSATYLNAPTEIYLRIGGSTNVVDLTSSALYPDADNSTTLGAVGNRWSNVYAFDFSAGNTPATDVSPTTTIITSQAPYASAVTNLSPASIVLRTPAPLAGGNTGFTIYESATTVYAAIGCVNNSTSVGGLWLGVSSFSPSNCTIGGDGTNTKVQTAGASGLVEILHAGTICGAIGLNGTREALFLGTSSGMTPGAGNYAIESDGTNLLFNTIGGSGLFQFLNAGTGWAAIGTTSSDGAFWLAGPGGISAGSTNWTLKCDGTNSFHNAIAQNGYHQLSFAGSTTTGLYQFMGVNSSQTVNTQNNLISRQLINYSSTTDTAEAVWSMTLSAHKGVLVHATGIARCTTAAGDVDTDNVLGFEYYYTAGYNGTSITANGAVATFADDASLVGMTFTTSTATITANILAGQSLSATPHWDWEITIEAYSI